VSIRGDWRILIPNHRFRAPSIFKCDYPRIDLRFQLVFANVADIVGSGFNPLVDHRCSEELGIPYTTKYAVNNRQNGLEAADFVVFLDVIGCKIHIRP
jgi:hypothetical protein